MNAVEISGEVVSRFCILEPEHSDCEFCDKFFEQS